MNESMLGIINATDDFSSLKELTLHRSLAALPFAGRYRLIDFMLSNMVNSDIHSVGIFTGHENRSLMDHLGSGKQWDLDRKRDGLFVFTPNSGVSQEAFGSFAHFARNKDYFLRSRQTYVVVTNCYTVATLNFKPILKKHIEDSADITEVRHEGRSLRTYILKKDLLMNLFEQHEGQGYCCIKDVVQRNLNSFKICTYDYNGYVAVIDSIDSYYKHSMEILRPDVWKQLFRPDAPIFTKVKDEPPTRYGKSGKISNSMIANGAIIEGEVYNSVIFRAVKIAKGTVVRNSIIMQKSQVDENCILDGVIVDKDVKIADGTSLAGMEDQPLVIEKGTVQGALMNS